MANQQDGYFVRTRIFELSHNGSYKNLSELAHAMGISISQIYRVRQGRRNINQKFIVGALQAFPGHKFDDLFYLSPEMPGGYENQRPAPNYLDMRVPKEPNKVWATSNQS